MREDGYRRSFWVGGLSLSFFFLSPARPSSARAVHRDIQGRSLSKRTGDGDSTAPVGACVPVGGKTQNRARRVSVVAVSSSDSF
ncbi:uncharacterized protein K489DRAFT_158384 [Dissoconium aciculare CBS 342.82]|uniref:Secreted protein n=1 Tax=Dissoconium aciculare CBS 342.82 TaxID=1314786 RepID=A0A6J3MCZ8_9PEZI|nr:uncharacterized protein K489DRAFT_158384 [Dissoconium aciculare CBS 342.82]KAF1825464.1 hypothetical protein K489DRAFT_158384 [Dissoconium aciculare CBS 342.82]